MPTPMLPEAAASSRAARQRHEPPPLELSRSSCWSSCRCWRSPAAGYWWLSGGRYVGTENAYVKAHIVQIAPEVAGPGAPRAGARPCHGRRPATTLLTIEPRPFRLALDSAEAELDTARTQVETPARHLARGGERAGRSRSAGGLLPSASGSARRSWPSRAWPRSASSTRRRTTRAPPPIASRREARSCRACWRRSTAIPQLPADEHPLVREKTRRARPRRARPRAHHDARPGRRRGGERPIAAGEQVKAATPLFVVVAMSRPWVEANIKETELTHVQRRPEGRASCSTPIPM